MYVIVSIIFSKTKKERWMWARLDWKEDEHYNYDDILKAPHLEMSNIQFPNSCNVIGFWVRIK
jgi:hypothetical protein